MREASVAQRILLACSRGATRLFRMNVGTAWVGEAVRFNKSQTVVVMAGDVLVRQARPFKAGMPGMSDYLGWTTKNGVAVFTAIEVKGKGGRVRPEQQRFIEAVQTAGGLSGVARSEDEARAILGDER